MSEKDLVPRRTQFSSCDECRKARVACDAGKARRNRADSDELQCCTRCLTRQLQCTFEVGRFPLLAVDALLTDGSISTVDEVGNDNVFDLSQKYRYQWKAQEISGSSDIFSSL